MFRNLILLIAIFIVVWLVARMIKKPASNKPQQQIEPEDMVKCEQCDSFVPRTKAINSNGHFFCSQQHLDAWKQ